MRQATTKYFFLVKTPLVQCDASLISSHMKPDIWARIMGMMDRHRHHVPLCPSELLPFGGHDVLHQCQAMPGALSVSLPARMLVGWT